MYSSNLGFQAIPFLSLFETSRENDLPESVFLVVLLLSTVLFSKGRLCVSFLISKLLLWGHSDMLELVITVISNSQNCVCLIYHLILHLGIYMGSKLFSISCHMKS